MSGHTPGPWIVKTPDRVLGCDARGQIYIHAKDVTVATVLDGDREANARLISEAPALTVGLAEAIGLIQGCASALHDTGHPKSAATLAEHATRLTALLVRATGAA